MKAISLEYQPVRLGLYSIVPTFLRQVFNCVTPTFFTEFNGAYKREELDNIIAEKKSKISPSLFLLSLSQRNKKQLGFFYIKDMYRVSENEILILTHFTYSDNISSERGTGRTSANEKIKFLLKHDANEGKFTIASEHSRSTLEKIIKRDFASTLLKVLKF